MVRNLRWYMVAMLMLVTAICYLDRSALAVAQTEIEEQFNMSNTDYGVIGFAFLIAYGIMHPFMGRIIDWLTTRRGLALAVAWWSIANMAHALAAAGLRGLRRSFV